VGKAVEAYEATLGVARGRGVEGSFVQRTAQALERLKRLVVAADAPGDDAAPSAPAHPAR
jgi:hypothetical protein